MFSIELKSLHHSEPLLTGCVCVLLCLLSEHRGGSLYPAPCFAFLTKTEKGSPTDG